MVNIIIIIIMQSLVDKLNGNWRIDHPKARSRTQRHK